MSEFLSTYEHPSGAVNTRLDCQVQQQLKDNQAVIESLLKIVFLLGKQGLAFRGHRDDKIDWEDFNQETGNQGNFIEMVHFRAETDSVLQKYLEHVPRNAQYMHQKPLVTTLGLKF